MRLKTVGQNKRLRRIFVLDAFPNYGLLHMDETLPAARHCLPFREVTRRLAAEAAEKDARFVGIHGDDILQSTDGLSCDLLHPSDEGHILMGQALAERIRRYVEEV